MSEVTETRAAHTKYQTPRRWTACARDKNHPTRFWTTSHPPETKVPGAHAPPLDVAVWTPAVHGLEPVSDGLSPSVREWVATVRVDEWGNGFVFPPDQTNGTGIVAYMDGVVWTRDVRNDYSPMHVSPCVFSRKRTKNAQENRKNDANTKQKNAKAKTRTFLIAFVLLFDCICFACVVHFCCICCALFVHFCCIFCVCFAFV